MNRKAVAAAILVMVAPAGWAQNPTAIGKQVRLTREGIGCSGYDQVLQILTDSFAYGNAYAWPRPNSASIAAGAKRDFYRRIRMYGCIYIVAGSSVTIIRPFGPTYAIAEVSFAGRAYWVGFPWEILGGGPESPPPRSGAP